MGKSVSQSVINPRKPRAFNASEFKKNGALFLMLLPGLIALIIFSYIPMGGIVMAFQKLNYSKFAFAGKWVGLRNLKVFFGSTYTPIMLRNTLLYNFAFIVLGRILSLFLAIGLNEIMGRTAKKVYQAIMFLPYFISWIAISYIAAAFLNHNYGALNSSILPMLGMEPMNWYHTPTVWPFIIILLNLWKGAGYGTVMFLASIAGIDKSLYESARIDGATRWQQITRITIPLLKPMIIVLTLLNIGSIFNTDIGLFYSVPMRASNGMLTNATQTIDTFVYINLMSSTSSSVNIASAGAFLQSMVGFVLVILSNLVVRKIDPESALF